MCGSIRNTDISLFDDVPSLAGGVVGCLSSAPAKQSFKLFRIVAFSTGMVQHFNLFNLFGLLGVGGGGGQHVKPF